MATRARDDTADWLLPEGKVPTVVELQRQVEEALAIARASEAAAIAIGDAAMRSAEQARRAADLAERAGERAASWTANGFVTGDAPPRQGPDEDRDEALARFISHADLVRARLVRLQG